MADSVEPLVAERREAHGPRGLELAHREAVEAVALACRCLGRGRCVPSRDGHRRAVRQRRLRIGVPRDGQRLLRIARRCRRARAADPTSSWKRSLSDEAARAAAPDTSAASGRCRSRCRRRRGCSTAAARASVAEEFGSRLHEAEMDEDVREAMVGQQIERPVVAANGIFSAAIGRRSSQGYIPVATAAQTGSGLRRPDRREVHGRRRFRAGARSSAAARRAARGQMYSSDAPSRRISITTRARSTACGGDGAAVTRGGGAATAGPARRERQRQRSEDRDREKRRADAAAAPAERIVRGREAEQHHRRRGRRRRAGRHPPRRDLAERRRSPSTFSHISAAATADDAAASHASTRTLTQPGDSGAKLTNSRATIRQIEHDGEMHAVEEAEREEPPPRRARHQRHAAD